jgi:hypothetical protein
MKSRNESRNENCLKTILSKTGVPGTAVSKLEVIPSTIRSSFNRVKFDEENIPTGLKG